MPATAQRLVLASSLLTACTGNAANEPAQAASPEARDPDHALKDTSPPVPDDKPDAKAEDPAPDSTAASTRTWTFDDALPGQVPAGIRLTETGGLGTPATWAVVADDSAPTKPHAFGVTESKNTKKTYNLALFEGTRYGDVDLQVMLRAVSGQLNGGGGPIWRVEDENNYYIARWDPTEDNAYLYVVRSGNRTALATVDLQLDHEAWHALRVVTEGPRIQLYIDDALVLSAEDSALTEPGMIGLWTKSDGATLFDDVSVGTP
ncbi:hypothetical protein [Paraliomyxa miuraensis]|uniref:hypothetical protein n=1 Tax=Paraliomyxa miuraensis TaxID=376150 RepID=UPI00225172AD|nr:hypothetical protein [Paraliomyxa miuraensis]MCX4243474.1 hypothetical protein [Paraliomyxa miuraensis]